MSLALRFTNLVSRLFVKPDLARATEPEANRKVLERGARYLFRAPPYALYREAWLTPNLRTLWIAARPGSRPVQAGKVVLYIHGGGFIAGSPETHKKMLARLAWMTGVEVCAPDYRIAPEHPFPAAIDDTRAAWDALVERGYAPENILLAGDSAGGNLIFALLGELLAKNVRPAGVAAMSPFTDFTYASPSITENEASDVMLPASQKGQIREWYLRDADPRDPLASPIFADFPNPPPALFQYAESEILRDDSRRMAEKLRAAGGDVTEMTWPHAIHVFQVFDGVLPEARDALEGVARFIRAHL